MKKLLALLMTLVFAVSLAACGNSDTGSENLTEGDVVSQTETSEVSTSSEQSSTADTTESKTESVASKPTSNNNSSKVSSTNTSSVQSKPSKPAKLNPKTDFKYGKYVAKYYSTDKKTYTVCTLIFDKEYESLQFERATYYTKEECERLYGGTFGFDADNLNEDFSAITLNGVKYYTFYYAYEILPESLEITDTVIKISPDNEKWGTLSLNADGTLVVDKTDSDRYGKVGTIFTAVEK